TGALDDENADVGAGVAPLAVGFERPGVDLPVAGPARGVAALYLPDDAGGAGDVAGVRAAAQRPPLRVRPAGGAQHSHHGTLGVGADVTGAPGHQGLQTRARAAQAVMETRAARAAAPRQRWAAQRTADTMPRIAAAAMGNRAIAGMVVTPAAPHAASGCRACRRGRPHALARER